MNEPTERSKPDPLQENDSSPQACQLRLRISSEVVDSLLLAGLRAALAGRGVTVKDIALELKTSEGRAASFRLPLTAAKSILLVPITVTIVIEGNFVIDDEFILTLHGLSAHTEGIVGWVVATLGLLTSQLEQWEGRTINLQSFFPGQQLRNVKIDSRIKTLSLAADFAG